MNKKSPIGVFDSGIGGLTVLKELLDKFPNEDFIYLADELNCPYGTKPYDEIKNAVLSCIKHLETFNVKLIIVACNTASNFIPKIKDQTKIPLISCIEPTALLAIKKTKSKKVGLIATNATIELGRYVEILKENGITCYAVKCSEFVEYVERNDLNNPILQKIISEKLEPLKNKIDTLIYGCTHFPFLEEQIKKVLGDITYISSGKAVAQLVDEYLKKNNLLNDANEKQHLTILTTKDVASIKEKIGYFNIPFNNIKKIGD